MPKTKPLVFAPFGVVLAWLFPWPWLFHLAFRRFSTRLPHANKPTSRDAGTSTSTPRIHAAGTQTTGGLEEEEEREQNIGLVTTLKENVDKAKRELTAKEAELINTMSTLATAEECLQASVEERSKLLACLRDILPVLRLAYATLSNTATGDTHAQQDQAVQQTAERTHEALLQVAQLVQAAEPQPPSSSGADSRQSSRNSSVGPSPARLDMGSNSTKRALEHVFSDSPMKAHGILPRPASAGRTIAVRL